MDNPQSYQPFLDALTAFASEEPRKADLLAAKAEYFQLTGEVFEDDKHFDSRMASFIEYYLMDRVSPLSGKTPAVEFFELKSKEVSAEEASGFRAFTET